MPAAELRAAALLYAKGPNSAIYYGLGVTEHAQGSTMVIGIANLAMACGMVGRAAATGYQRRATGDRGAAVARAAGGRQAVRRTAWPRDPSVRAVRSA